MVGDGAPVSPDGVGIFPANGASGASCPGELVAPNPLLGVPPVQETLDYWLGQWDALGLDAPVMTPDQIRRHHVGWEHGSRREGSADSEGPSRTQRRFDSKVNVDEASLQRTLEERLGYMAEAIESGRYVDRRGQRVEGGAHLGAALWQRREGPEPGRRFVRVSADASLRCAPIEGALLRQPDLGGRLDPRFDRNLCSSIRTGEVLEDLGSAGRGGTASSNMHLVRTPYVMGWVEAGVVNSGVAVEPERMPAVLLTRRAFLTSVFRTVGQAYGWGGADLDGDGVLGIDCSRLVMDTMGEFGLRLPRNSGGQAGAGTYTVDVGGAGEAQKLATMDLALKSGVTLLGLDGHIMVYLGRDAQQRPRVLHSLWAYRDVETQRGCEIDRVVGKVAVTGLELGGGSSKGSLLERVHSVTVFGSTPPVALDGVAILRPPGELSERGRTCQDSSQVALFRSPRVLVAGEAARVVVVANRDGVDGPAAFDLYDPEGKRVNDVSVEWSKGEPLGWVAQWVPRQLGRWTAILRDGDHAYACEQFFVRSRRPRPEARQVPMETVVMDDDGRKRVPAWDAKWRWEADTENLYALFVQKLFDYPFGEAPTWPNLQVLLGDPERNILFNHLGEDEDDKLRLEPDCADLPYFLRAYFAWKVGLPFAFRRCSRGRGERPPSCGEPNLPWFQVSDDVEPVGGAIPLPSRAEMFSRFLRDVKGGVHSATARTRPEDPATDLYPVALTRADLKPGTVYADPDGHLLVVTRWVPQTFDRPGMMIASDAQPDGTIGLRRFWRGTFLFRPERRSMGPGFKAWRPLVFDQESREIHGMSNRDITRSGVFPGYSEQQYEGTADDFYDAMEGLIQPLPRDAEQVMTTLVDALEESVRRRVVSVDNGVRYMEAHGWAVVEMPDLDHLFQTSGPWEDYSTPSRDMRLLIALDAVRGFPGKVARQPARFGIVEDVSKAVADVGHALERQLEARSFSYRRSNGQQQALTLKDIVRRRGAFEVAYNPNDCPEVRWGALGIEEEMVTCTHRAPREQQKWVEEHRNWFHDRRRPPR